MELFQHSPSVGGDREGGGSICRDWPGLCWGMTQTKGVLSSVDPCLYVFVICVHLQLF